MGKILHITNHPGTIKNFKSVCKYLNISDDLQEENIYGVHGYTNEETANNIWKTYGNRLDEYDILLFTDTAMVARPFLQNLDKHKCKIIMYLTTRFNWGVPPEDTKFYKLFTETSRNPRVSFVADNIYDQYYAELHDIQMACNTPIKLTPYLHPTNIMHTRNELFAWSRASRAVNFVKYLDERNIKYDIFGEGYKVDTGFTTGLESRPFRDQEHICEYKGLLHLPYQVNIQGLWENLGYGIIYFIPSRTFIRELINKHTWYWWEEHKTKSLELADRSIDLSEWYLPEHYGLFEYFDSWNHLKEITDTITDEHIINKKQYISEFMKNNNLINLEKWEKIIYK